MTAPITAWADRLAASFALNSPRPIISLLFLGTLASGPLLVASAVLAGRKLVNTATPVKECFAQLSVALVPFALTVWVAHLLFHGSTGWSTAWPVLQRVASELGTDWLGRPHWAGPGPLFSQPVMLGIQLLLLDAGVLLSIYAGWRVARRSTSHVMDGLLLFAPWAVILALLYCVGVWVFLQPMQMRGMVHS